MAFLDLPNELVIQILSDLTNRDLIACQLSNKLLHTAIKDSVLLQFKIALSTFKATDSPTCPLSLAERLQALKDSEAAWSYLRRDFERRIVVDFAVSGIYDLTGGVFLLGNADRSALHYIKLPSSIEDDAEWRMIQVDHGEGRIIDMGFCVYEHDLLAVITTQPRHGIPHTTYDIKLVLFKLSTGEPHPAAKESTILVLNSQWESPRISVEIVGDHLVLILTHHHNHWIPHDRVYIYDWCNAELKMSFEALHNSYSGLVFLSENLIVIPNARTNALEIWDIFSTSKKPHPACILQLPELVTGNTLLYITCRSEPNPIGSKSRLPSDKPFYRAAHEAVVLFHIHVQLGDPVIHQQQHGGGLVFAYTYTLFVHRKALCEVYERHCAEMNSGLGESLGTPELSVQVEDSGFEDSEMDEMIIDDDDSDGWESVVSDNGDDMAIRATDDDPIPIPWSSWGPPITRWLSADTMSTRWITTTAGQRAVLCHSQDGVCQYVVLDFNPENVRRVEKMLESLPLGAQSRLQSFRNLGGVETEGIFKESIVSELPFVGCTSGGVHGWNGALMDEERVLGLMVDADGHISAISVHHFGGAQN
ncbi:hypothetical protein BYT27DRAFT_7238326 [Phlegmacium glaucopus]|nr:hypothetical protein BYT27DRAFT_7238326 [Phlegmacium glaucopus]